MSVEIYGTPLTFTLGLVDQSNRPQFRVSPTIAAGDFKVSTGGGALTNIATLPDVYPVGSKSVRIQLSAAEMSGAVVTVIASDVAGAEWDDVIISIPTEPIRAELLAVPPAASSTDDRIGWLFMRSRNKKTQAKNPGGTQKIFADNGATVIGQTTVTDDGTTTTVNKIT